MYLRKAARLGVPHRNLPEPLHLELLAAAGIWRDTPEWGLTYSMVMTDACVHVAGVHDRMPVILPRESWADWQDGATDAARLLCQPYPAEMTVRRTAEPWVQR